MERAGRRPDVVVVGGGAAGAASAIALSRLGARVVVIDRRSTRPILGETLPPAAARVLAQVGLELEPAGRDHLPVYGNRSSWGSVVLAESDFIHQPPGHGWRIDRPAFDAELRRALDAAAVPRLDARVQAPERGTRTRWILTLSMGDETREIHTDFLVDASGRSRRVVRMLGIPQRTYDRLTAVVGLFVPGNGREDRDSRTEIEATPDGWWYAGLLPDGHLLAGYLTDVDSLSFRQSRSRAGFSTLLDEAGPIASRVHTFGYTLDGPLHAVAAHSSRLQRAGGDGWCAVGDAYATFDPLSSGGILSALESGRRAAEAIAGSESGGLERFDALSADNYARYLAQWLSYYAMESRWPTSTFWERRHNALRDVLGEGDPGRTRSTMGTQEFYGGRTKTAQPG